MTSKPPRPRDSYRKDHLPEQCAGVLEHIAEAPRRFERQRMAIDVNAVEHFVRRFVARALLGR